MANIDEEMNLIEISMNEDEFYEDNKKEEFDEMAEL